MVAKRGQSQQVNPYLRASFLEIVSNQLKANDPPETKETFDILKYKKPFNLKRYVKNLQRLPKPPQE